MTKATARGVVQGTVQGVWFRAFTREQALQQGLDGFARNQPDGSVSFALSGSRAGIEKVLAALEEGPPLAKVARVEVSWHSYEPMQGFETG